MGRSGEETPRETSDVLLEELDAVFGAEKTRSLKAKLAGIGAAEERLEAVHAEAAQLGATALCLSGGGVRSASFALGVLQALAGAALKDGRPALAHFHYLSTVSGGGYIGSWLSAWLHWAGSDAVLKGLVTPGSDDRPEPDPIDHIRKYSSYLTPKLGLLSSDTWAAVAICSRNLILNWLVLFPALWLLILVPKILAASMQLARLPASPAVVSACAAVSALLVAVACCYTTANRLSDRSLCPFDWDAQRSFVLMDLVPLTGAGALFTWLVNRPEGAVAWLVDWSWLPWLAAGGASIYLVGFVAGVLLSGGIRRSVRLLVDAATFAASGAAAASILWLLGHVYAHDIPDSLTLLGAHLDAKSLLVAAGTPCFLLAVVAGQLLFVLLNGNAPHGDVEREWLGRAGGWYLVTGLGWLAGSTIVLFASAVPTSLGFLGEHVVEWLAPLGGLSGVASAVLGASAKTPARGQATSLGGILVNVGLAAASIVFGLAIVILSAIAIDQLAFGKALQETQIFLPGGDVKEAALYRTQWWHLGYAVAIVGAAWLAAGLLVNPNRFSLHALYRNRLIRAFLGGPHLAAPAGSQRQPNLFTGFDEHDNIRMAELWPASPRPTGEWRPFHVVNIALNLVAGSNLAWQQRKAEAFVATPLACGAHDIGYRTTRDYGGQNAGGISLGTAMAISGAAASPNMGYHSSPAVTLLLAVLNVRLGWWLGNPGKAGDDTYRLNGPRLAFKPFLAELFGLTTNTGSYVYLSDGGHFDNLGLYEMVRRRCAVMVVSDAGQDGDYTFSDLGNAVRKIRIDLGLDVHFPALTMFHQPQPPEKGWKRPFFAIGSVVYPEGGTGQILYIKPGLRGDEPADVIAYSRQEADFPHQSTGDQWFDEPQFEAYRQLGRHMVQALLAQVDLREHADLAGVLAALNDLNPLLMSRPVQARRGSEPPLPEEKSP